ncbi:MAG: hypothetical protein ACREED_07770, partial [Stellaceae bacterium]
MRQALGVVGAEKGGFGRGMADQRRIFARRRQIYCIGAAGLVRRAIEIVVAHAAIIAQRQAVHAPKR